MRPGRILRALGLVLQDSLATVPACRLCYTQPLDSSICSTQATFLNSRGAGLCCKASADCLTAVSLERSREAGICELSLENAVQAIVDDPLMRHSAVLVFANKQDMVRSLPPAPTAGSPMHGLC